MRKARLAIGLCASVLIIAFFFVAPVVSANIIPCLVGENGYTSLSYHYFHIGEIDLNGRFSWSTQDYSNCI
jgi:hypothetical protein